MRCIGNNERGWPLKLFVRERSAQRERKGDTDDRRQEAKDKNWADADLLLWCDRPATGNVDASCLSVANLRKVEIQKGMRRAQ